MALGLVEIKGVKYAIDLIRSLKAEEGKFLAGSIRADDREIWHFKKAGYNGICTVTEVGDEVVLCFISYGNQLEGVVPLDCLFDLKTIGGEMVTAMDIRKAILLKRRVAKEIGAVAKLSPNEEKASAYLSAKQREKENNERLEKSRLKEERRDEIMSRIAISAYTETGAGRFGRPVVGEEWQCLHSGVYVILVESYNKETKECGPAMEAFAVKKGKGGRIEKENISKVKDGPPALANVKAKRVVIVDVDGSIKQVLVYNTIGEIQLAQKAGLNGGSVVTSEDQRDEKGKYFLSLVTVSEIKKLGSGSFRPL
ncbi:MAG: hypothetical protein COU71_00420 [Parcubacteria group bacterium CG10_big_fil_rev_8_21_14_0_10_38_31]|nr:MAG: hypothetical protein COU71_00420 [Parcubacteria group bacterium CG10_big_fil_rev_8_21_14_0_10_38_31]